MRAIVISAAGGPEVLQLRDVPTPRPAAGEVQVRVRAAGVNRADVLQRQGHYPPPPGAPGDIPGLEYAGEVAALGAGARAWKVGDRVMGLVPAGGYAEAVTVNEAVAMPVPSAWTFEEAAAVPEAFITAYDALFRQMGLRSGERVLIHAVGSGVGTAALQLAKAFGARTFGTSRSAAKLARATALGLEVAIDTSKADFAEVVKQRTAGEGVDVVFDLVGGPVLAGSIQALARGGRMIVVGLTGGRSATIDLGMLLSKRLTLVGTVLRARTLEEKIGVTSRFAAEVLPLLEGGIVRPVVERSFPLADAAEAHRVLESDAVFGKLVLLCDQANG
ncbi:MAG TPA: NAD(P)H-quinone oxidoreductase [Gemmatimonadales bacterium]|nr:NAD(P)H-quinone oxidoreductase [Gemmatimonadales bacterium]